MAVVYEIVVSGELGPTAACAFEGMRLDVRSGETAIVGPVVDQSHLAGLLGRVSDLGLSLVSVTPVPETDVPDAGGGPVVSYSTAESH